jgi:hypothetical protein
MIRGNKVKVTTTGAVSVQILGPNPHRVGLLVSMPDTNGFFIAFGEPAANNDGLRFQGSTSFPWILLFDKPNDFITQSISVFHHCCRATEFRGVAGRARLTERATFAVAN